jgi:autotransporter-associated beta strand protein
MKNKPSLFRPVQLRALAIPLAFTLGLAGAAQADTIYWDGAGGTAELWSSVPNWSTVIGGGTDPAAIPGASDVAVFHATSVAAGQTIQTRGNRSVQGLEFTTSNATTIRSHTSSNQNSTLTIGSSGITKTGTGAVTVAGDNANRRLDIVLSANQTWQNNNAAGVLTIATNLSTGGFLTSAGGAQMLTLSGTSTLINRINSQIQDGSAGGTVSIIKDGAGTWMIFPRANANTYTGGTTVKDGLLIVNVDGTSLAPLNSLGNGNVTLQGGTISFRATGTQNSTPENINFNSNIVVTGDATIDVIRTGATSQNKTIEHDKLTIGAKTLTVTGAVGYDLRFNGITTLTGNATLSPTSAKLTLAQAIGDGGSGYSLTKTGANSLMLSAANTYSGATTVGAGSLILGASGSIANTSTIDVQSGATFDVSAVSVFTVGGGQTLKGGGTIKGATTIDGTLAPGASTGILTFENALTLAGSTVMEIDGTAGAGLVGGHDFINLTGVGAAGLLTYGGTMTLDISTLFGAGTYSWNLFEFASETGGFTSISLTDQYSGSLTDAGGGVWGLTSGNDSWSFTESTGVLGLTVIPEPGAALLGGLGLIALLRRRR